jgi:uncharacterized protein YqeY
MINIIEEKHKAMKMSPSQEKDARTIVLNEIRTKEQLETSEINNEKQYKWFDKMYKDRANVCEIYKNQGRSDLYTEEQLEMSVIKEYMDILFKDFPKQLSDDEVKDIILSLKSSNPFNIGIVMKYFSVNYQLHIH